MRRSPGGGGGGDEGPAKGGAEPALAGWLSKGKRQSTRHFGFGGGVQLTKRWFKVTRMAEGPSGAGALALSYYKNERSYEARGWLLLKEATRIMGVTPTCFVSSDVDSRVTRHCEHGA